MCFTKFVFYRCCTRDVAIAAYARIMPTRSNNALCSSLNDINLFACEEACNGHGSPAAAGGFLAKARLNSDVFVIACV